jgi:hypothetical protein
MKEINIQKSERRGSGCGGSSELGFGAPGSIGLTITRWQGFEFGLRLPEAATSFGEPQKTLLVPC